MLTLPGSWIELEKQCGAQEDGDIYSVALSVDRFQLLNQVGAPRRANEWSFPPHFTLVEHSTNLYSIHTCLYICVKERYSSTSLNVYHGLYRLRQRDSSQPGRTGITRTALIRRPLLLIRLVFL